MRLIAYVWESADSEAIQRHLAAQDGVGSVAMRNARWWGPAERPEPRFDAVYAPGYPAIVAAYAAAGVPAFQCEAWRAYRPPEELDTLPQAAVVTIVCPGIRARAVLAARPPEGVIIAVNGAMRMLARADYWVANDGFGVAVNQGVQTEAVRVTRASRAATLPGGPWYDLERLGISDGLWSTCCALRFAREALGAQRIILIGNDCTTGVGTPGLSSHYDHGTIDGVRRASLALVEQYAAAGVVTEWLRWVGDAALVERHPPLPALARPDLSALLELPRCDAVLAQRLYECFGLADLHALAFHLRGPAGQERALALPGVGKRTLAAWLAWLDRRDLVAEEACDAAR